MRAGLLMVLKRKTTNTQHRTSNAEPDSAASLPLNFDVQSSMFDVRCSSCHSPDFLQQPVQQFTNGDALLFAVIAMANRHRVQQLRLLPQRVEINRHAERRARFILTRVAAANRTRGVVETIGRG